MNDERTRTGMPRTAGVLRSASISTFAPQARHLQHFLVT